MKTDLSYAELKRKRTYEAVGIILMIIGFLIALGLNYYAPFQNNIWSVVGMTVSFVVGYGLILAVNPKRG